MNKLLIILQYNYLYCLIIFNVSCNHLYDGTELVAVPRVSQDHPKMSHQHYSPPFIVLRL